MLPHQKQGPGVELLPLPPWLVALADAVSFFPPCPPLPGAELEEEPPPFLGHFASPFS